MRIKQAPHHKDELYKNNELKRKVKKEINLKDDDSCKYHFGKIQFKRLVQEITYSYKGNLRWSEKAIEALKCEAENHMITLFESAYDCTLHAGRVTLEPDDIKLAMRLMNKNK